MHPSRILDFIASSPQTRERLDSVVRMASHILHVPVAYVTLFDRNVERIMSNNAGETTLLHDPAFSTSVQEARGSVCICSDARAPLNGLGFCAGVALVHRSDDVTGALYVADIQERDDLTLEQLTPLLTLARHAVLEIEQPYVTSQLRLFNAWAEQASDAILFAEQCEPGGQPSITYVNKAFERMTGYRLDEVSGVSPTELFFPTHSSPDALSAIRGALKMRSPIQLEAINRRKDGSGFLADLSLLPLFDDDRNCTNWISIRRDVTAYRRTMFEAERARARNEVHGRMKEAIRARERAEQALSYLSYHDVLTGLPNRSLLLGRVRDDLAKPATGSILIVNLDRFKSVNATFGREISDLVLSEISERLRQSCDETAMIARMEADNFVLWMADADANAARHTASRILETIYKPITIKGQHVSVTASIGIAELSSGNYGRPEDGLRDADIAMYHAKRLGGHRYHVFTAELHNSVLNAMRVEISLNRALEQDEFVLHYQPIVSLHTQRIVALEALLRWYDPQRGMIPPGIFIPIAERSGQIVAIGRHVFQRACADAGAFRACAGKTAPMLNVNISGFQLADETFADLILQTLSERKLPPDALCLEITETALIEQVDIALTTLKKLVAAGVKTAIDDFGTGFSSLAYLRRLPFREMKIDRSFISGTDDGIADTDIVEMMISLAKTRQMSVVAEGVETGEQLRIAKQLGCDAAQGFFIHAPMPLDAVLEMLPKIDGNRSVKRR